MAETITPAVPERLVWNTVRRRWRILVGGLVLGLVLGALLGARQHPAYQSSMTLIINPLEGNPYSPASVQQRSDANTDTETEARLASTDVVASLAERALGLPQGSLNWQSDLAVSVVPNTQVIKFGYTASTPAQARADAEAMGEAFLSYRARRSQDSVTSQLSALDERSAAVQKQLSDASKKLNATNLRSDRTFLNQQVTTYTEQLAAIATQAAQLSSANRNPGQVLTPATTPTATGIGATTTTAGGAIVGLLLAAVLAFVRERTDLRLHDASAIEAYGVPVLARLHERRRGLRRLRRLRPAAETREQLRLLRAAVGRGAPPPAIVAVTDLVSGERSAGVAEALAEYLSRSAYDVTSVLAVPPATHHRRKESAPTWEPGLSDVLLGSVEPTSITTSAAPHLRVVIAGSRMADASEYLPTPVFRRALAGWSETSDYVVIAGGAALDADAHAIAAASTHVLIVCRLHRSRSDELERALSDFARAGANVLGVVLDDGAYDDGGSVTAAAAVPAQGPSIPDDNTVADSVAAYVPPPSAGYRVRQWGSNNREGGRARGYDVTDDRPGT